MSRPISPSEPPRSPPHPTRRPAKEWLRPPCDAGYEEVRDDGITKAGCFLQTTMGKRQLLGLVLGAPELVGHLDSEDREGLDGQRFRFTRAFIDRWLREADRVLADSHGRETRSLIGLVEGGFRSACRTIRTPVQRELQAERTRAARAVSATRRAGYADYLEASSKERVPDLDRRLFAVSDALKASLASNLELAKAAHARAERELATAQARPDTWPSKAERLDKATVRLRISKARLVLAQNAMN